MRTLHCALFCAAAARYHEPPEEWPDEAEAAAHDTAQCEADDRQDQDDYQPCSLCHRPTLLIEPYDRRPCHKTCAEAAIAPASNQTRKRAA